MKNVGRLLKDIDSLKINNLEKVEAFSKNIVTRMGAFPTPKKKDTYNLKDLQEIKSPMSEPEVLEPTKE